MTTIPSTTWDPQQYARFSDERGRPFRDLLARVLVERPRLVVDLGCGDGPLTLSLATRWPEARVVGVDSSPQMLGQARRLDDSGRVEWVQADLTDWDPGSLGCPADVIVTNATLQWVPEHRRLLDGWVGALSPGGWFAMQVPGNADAPSHALMRAVAAEHPRRVELESALERAEVAEPSTYLALLSGLGCDVDAWETTYTHVLDPSGTLESPVLEWVRGTGLRPVLDVLAEPAERAAFLDEYDRRLRAAYPRTAAGVVLPFRRVFAVAHTPPATEAAEASVVGLHHVQVACPAGSEDLVRGFYGDLLGMPEIPKPPRLARRGGVWFRAGDRELHCGVEPDFAPARKAHPCLSVDGIDELAGAVARAGGEVRWDESIEGVRRFHTEDPVGNRVELQQL